LINVMRKQFKNKSIASHLLGLLRDDEIWLIYMIPKSPTRAQA
jgi:hypothetical protein